jgi:hypothetical protein
MTAKTLPAGGNRGPGLGFLVFVSDGLLLSLLSEGFGEAWFGQAK